MHFPISRRAPAVVLSLEERATLQSWAKARSRAQRLLQRAQSTPKRTPISNPHLIVDNYGTHKHPSVKSWLKRDPRFHLHFIPTSSSLLNLVERDRKSV